MVHVGVEGNWGPVGLVVVFGEPEEPVGLVGPVAPVG